ncbi:MAG: hypothetical protein ACJ72Z_02605 [Pyrinomonadaceae bacterium]
MSIFRRDQIPAFVVIALAMTAGLLMIARDESYRSENFFSGDPLTLIHGV